VELTDGKIKHAAIERTMGGRIDHTTTNKKSTRMWVLRVGTVAPGETPPSNTAINREEDEPPRINKQMRRAKMNLAVDLTIKMHLFSEGCPEYCIVYRSKYICLVNRYLNYGRIKDNSVFL
jgi:hypothetical protein